MKAINKSVKIVAKVLEILHWATAALFLCAAIVPKWFERLVSSAASGNSIELSAYGFEITAGISNGVIDTTTFVLFSVSAFFIFCLMAMVFRNLYLILKKSENDTPFQKDNVRMVREIGIFSISIPVISLIMNIISRCIIGYETAEIATGIDGFITGIIILCLSQVFARGVKLENDVDGLL